jgi:hypothetical protein
MQASDSTELRATSRIALLHALLGCFVLATPVALRAENPAVQPIIYTSKQLDKAPQLKRSVRVRYPRSVKKGDEIVFRFLVTKEGKVAETTIVRFTNDAMVEPAMTAFERVSFSPGERNGQAVDALIEITDVMK